MKIVYVLLMLFGIFKGAPYWRHEYQVNVCVNKKIDGLITADCKHREFYCYQESVKKYEKVFDAQCRDTLKID